MIKDFTERYLQESCDSRFWNINKQIGIFLAVLLVVVIMFNTTGCSKGNEELVEEPIAQELEQDTIKVGDDGVNAAIAPDDDVSIVVSDEKVLTDNMVAMSIEDFGRSDPFLPLYESKNVTQPKRKTAVNYELMAPPESITVDTAAAEVITTKVSGIMYDKFNPSAILNISGSDYLVRTGDVINNYKVLSIAKENVTVQYGANIYKAGVGELFTGDGVNFNTISNLESKFGGRKNAANKF